MDIPVVLIIYNRPDKTRRSFEAIRAVKPTCLYIIADGPKHEQDAHRVRQARSITEQVDWDCQVHRIYAQENLGSGYRVASGLDHVFSECDKAIIVEDDIIATPAFFTFCSRMLARYEHDSRIMSVAGWNGLVAYQSESDACDAFLSQYSSIWGWATWRRAWAKYQYDPSWSVDEFDAHIRVYYKDSFRPKLQRHKYVHRFWNQYKAWDIQWAMTISMYQGFIVTPTVNLCQNIGFDSEATNLTSFNIRGLFPAFNPNLDISPLNVLEEHGPVQDWYDYSLLLVTILSQYQDIRKLALLHKNPHLIPKHQDRIGWECSLQPFNEPERCVQILTHLERYFTHPELTKCKDVFQRLL
ncbi:glycosyltransferase family protein [Spirosoma gilvum]